MALWPFRRKSGRKRARSRTNLSDSEGLAHADRLTQLRSHTMDDLPVKSRRTLKKRRTDPLAPHVPRSRDGSYSPGRQDQLSINRHRLGANIQGRQAVDPSMRPSGFRSYERIGDDAMWSQVPTLHGKGNNQLARKKSSKRRRQDQGREAEIRALANFGPVRPRAEAWPSTKTARSGNRSNTGSALGQHWDSRSSDISLPTAASIRSGMSSDSDLGAFQISALDSLAPRPTLRYTSNPRWAPPNGHGPSRTNSQRRKLAERPSIPEETIRAHKRIQELADDLDASDLRELMERDQRRRERKQLRDQARAERRLSRLAEKQRAAYQAALEQGSPLPQNLERGVAGRELDSLGIDTTSAVVTSSTQRPENEVLNQVDQYDGASESSARRPLAQFHRTNSAPLDTVTPQEEPAVEEYAPPSPASPILGRLLGSKKPASKFSYDPGQSRSTISPAPGALESMATSPSSVGTKKTRRSFSSFFRWSGGKTKRTSQPSSFSNTSREEMQAVIQNYTPEPAVSLPVAPAASAAPVAVVAAVATKPVPSRTLSGGIPKRTRSRFREDLPELPLSPPDSRRASPETVPIPIPEHPRDRNEAGQDTEIPEDMLTPTGPTVDVVPHHPSGFSQDSHGPSPQPHSISLASIDSEASWLSGRLGGKRSPTSRHRRQGPTSSRATSRTGSEDEHGIAEDEYLARLTPAQLTRTTSRHRQSTGDALPSSDEDEPMHDGDMKWGVSARRQVHVSGRNPHDSLRSHEAVLNSFDEENEMEVEGQSEADDVVDPEKGCGLQRATSVKLHGRAHARQISAGSAKLLEITPRQSTDSKRRSSGPVFI